MYEMKANVFKETQFFIFIAPLPEFFLLQNF